MGALQKFEIFVKYENDLKKAREIISESKMVGDLLNSKKNCMICEDYKELHVSDEGYYLYNLYNELFEIKEKLTEAGYEAKVFYLNLEDMDEI